MEIKSGKRKSFDVEYVEVTEDNINEVAEWSLGVVGGSGKHRFVRLSDKNAMNAYQKKAFIGDFVTHSLETRTFKKFSRNAFHKVFETSAGSLKDAMDRDEQEINRDASTGKFVTEEYAEDNPETTVHETRPIESVTLDAVDEAPALTDDEVEEVLQELPRDADPS